MSDELRVDTGKESGPTDVRRRSDLKRRQNRLEVWEFRKVTSSQEHRLREWGRLLSFHFFRHDSGVGEVGTVDITSWLGKVRHVARVIVNELVVIDTIGI